MLYCSGEVERFFNGVPVRGARGSMAGDTGAHLVVARCGRGNKGDALLATRGELLGEGAFPAARASQDQNEAGSRGRYDSCLFRGREMLFLAAVHAGNRLSRKLEEYKQEEQYGLGYFCNGTVDVTCQSSQAARHPGAKGKG